MRKVLSSLAVIGGIGALLALQIFLSSRGIPIFFLDLLMPIVILPFSYILFKNTNWKRPNFKYDKAFFIALFMSPLYLFLIYHGIQSPLEEFYGMRGSTHGYTMVLMGSFLLLLCIKCFFRDQELS